MSDRGLGAEEVEEDLRKLGGNPEVSGRNLFKEKSTIKRRRRQEKRPPPPMSVTTRKARVDAEVVEAVAAGNDDDEDDVDREGMASILLALSSKERTLPPHFHESKRLRTREKVHYIGGDMGSCEHKIIADDERPNIRLESLHPTITTTEPDLPMIRGVILPSEVGGSTVKFTMKTREDLRRVVRRPWVTLAVIKFMFAVGILPTQAVAGQVAAAVQKTVEATEHSVPIVSLELETQKQVAAPDGSVIHVPCRDFRIRSEGAVFQFSGLQAQQALLCSMLERELSYDGFETLEVRGVGRLCLTFTIPNQCSLFDYFSTRAMIRASCLYMGLLRLHRLRDDGDAGGAGPTPQVKTSFERSRRLVLDPTVAVVAEGHTSLIYSLYGLPGLQTLKVGGSLVPIVCDMGGGTMNLSTYRVRRMRQDGLDKYDVRSLTEIGFMGGGCRIDAMIKEMCNDVKPKGMERLPWTEIKMRLINTAAESTWTKIQQTREYAAFSAEMTDGLRLIVQLSAFAMRQAKAVVLVLTGMSFTATRLCVDVESHFRRVLEEMGLEGLNLHVKKHQDKDMNARGAVVLGHMLEGVGGEVTLHNLPIDFEFVRSASVLHIWLRDNEAEGTVLAAGHKTYDDAGSEIPLEFLFQLMLCSEMTEPDATILSLAMLLDEVHTAPWLALEGWRGERGSEVPPRTFAADVVASFLYFESALPELLHHLSRYVPKGGLPSGAADWQARVVETARRAALGLPGTPTPPPADLLRAPGLPQTLLTFGGAPVWASLGVPFVHMEERGDRQSTGFRVWCEGEGGTGKAPLRAVLYSGSIFDDPTRETFRGLQVAMIDEAAIDEGFYEPRVRMTSRGDLQLTLQQIPWQAAAEEPVRPKVGRPRKVKSPCDVHVLVPNPQGPYVSEVLDLSNRARQWMEGCSLATPAEEFEAYRGEFERMFGLLGPDDL